MEVFTKASMGSLTGTLVGSLNVNLLEKVGWMFNSKLQGNFNGMFNKLINGMISFTTALTGSFKGNLTLNWNVDRKFKWEL